MRYISVYGESIENESSLAATTEWIPKRVLENAANCMIDFKSKCLRRDFASRFIPRARIEELFVGLGMKTNASHPRRKSLARTSSHGIVSTAPDSICRQRRSASTAQSSSISGSGGG